MYLILHAGLQAKRATCVFIWFFSLKGQKMSNLTWNWVLKASILCAWPFFSVRKNGLLFYGARKMWKHFFCGNLDSTFCKAGKAQGGYCCEGRDCQMPSNVPKLVASYIVANLKGTKRPFFSSKDDEFYAHRKIPGVSIAYLCKLPCCSNRRTFYSEYQFIFFLFMYLIVIRS